MADTDNPRFHGKQPFRGLNLDNIPSQKQEGFVSYSLNGIVEGSTNDSSIVYQNEEANQFCCSFPDGYKLIGHKNIIEENVIIVWLANSNTGESEIGKVIDCVYTTYINDNCLNLDISDPILEVSYKKSNCDTEVYWASKKNPRRFVSINKIPYINDDPAQGLDCNKLLINPNFSIPTITIDSISAGGDNQAGTYQFTVQYANAIGEAYTSFYNVTNPTPLFDDKITLDFNYIVGKTINLTISNIDTSGYYDYINVAVIKTINNITSTELIGTYAITRDSMQVHYSGQKQLIQLSLNDIFQKFPIYEKADGIYNVQDVLAWYGVTTEERINYQSIASQITLQWETYRLKANNPYKDEIVATNLKSYCRDEVYPFELVLELTNGYQTDGFTIPGRVAKPSDLTIVNAKPLWQSQNTASRVDYTNEYKSAVDKINYEGSYEYGEFSYWESQDVYPNNQLIYGTLSNQPIRHHKFPDSSVTHIHDDNNYIYPIGVRIDIEQIKSLILNSNLTDEQKSKIQGFKIVRGNRAVHKSVIAKGIIRNVLKYRNDGKPIDTNNAFDDTASSNEPQVISILKSTLKYVQKARTLERVDEDPVRNISLQALLDSKYNIIQAQINTFLNNPSSSIPPGILDPSATPSLNTSLPASYISNLYTDPFSIINNIYYLINNSLGVLTHEKPITEASDNYLNIALQNLEQLVNQYNNVNNINSTFSVPTASISNDSETEFYFPNYLFNDVRTPNQSDNYLNNISFDVDCKSRYTFHSPDTSFFQPALGNKLKLETIEYGFSSGRMFQVKNHAGYKIFTNGLFFSAIGASTVTTLLSRWIVVGFSTGSTIIDGAAAIQTYQIIVDILQKCVPYVNYAYQFNAVGNYDKFTLPIKKHLSEIDLYSYTQSSMLNVNDDRNLNNWQRESSVYLKLNDEWKLPQDNSILPKVLLEDTTKNFSADINETIKSPTSLYYTSIKMDSPNQWGQLYSYETIDTGFYSRLDAPTKYKTIFGGDTFINKFSFKTKIPFFTDNRVGAPDGSDIFYDELSNVGKAKYWYTAKTKAQEGSGFLSKLTGTLFGTKAHQLYNDESAILYRTGQMFLFAYGIPTFYCESSVNVDLRQAFNNREGDFYPHVGTSIPNDWLQEINVPIAQDNTYYYNKTFSKQNKENFFSHLPQDWDFSQCRTYFPYRTVFSEQARDLVNPSERNNWLIYKPSSFFDFPQNYGKLTSLAGIENKQVLARFENKSLLYNVLLTAPTSAAQVYLGQSLFSQQVPPLDYADTDTGYVGSQHKFLLKTEYGHITADAKRGQVFLLQGQQVKDLTLEAVSKFFTEYLNFSILKQFPNYNIDNAYKGIGLTGTYDQKYNRLILTKLDYEVLDKTLKYDDEGFYHEIKTTTKTPSPILSCSPGYTLENGVCVKTEYINATPVGTPTTFTVGKVAPERATTYGVEGTYVFDEYNIDGTGPTITGCSLPEGVTKLPTNDLWQSTSHSVSGDWYGGRLNSIGFWNDTGLYEGTVSFTYEVTVAEDKDVYIGFGADETPKIVLNCETIIEITNNEPCIPVGADCTPIRYYFWNNCTTDSPKGLNLGPNGSFGIVNRAWLIYKIRLIKGTNYLVISNTNTNGPGAFGFEIYDNTLFDLQNATFDASDINDIRPNLNIIGSSRDLLIPSGQVLDSINYTCPTCSGMVLIDGVYKCPTILTQAPNTTYEYIDTEIIVKEYVPFTNKEVFCNKSFTISYDFDNQAWVSFHSYLPNYYIPQSNYFYTGLNSAPALWEHNTSFSTFNTFYGTIEPYILEVPYTYKLQDEILQSVSDYATVLKIDNFEEFTETDDYFNKLILYSNQQCSGVLKLTKKPLSNLKAYNEYPKYFSDCKEVLYTKADNLYKVNTFWSLLKDNKKPVFIKSCKSLSEFKELNQANMEYSQRNYKKQPIRSDDLKVRYILDNRNDIKVMSKINTINTQISYK